MLKTNEHIRRCKQCEQYTLTAVCADCGAKTINIRPPKYSPEDRYGTYRRQMKQTDADTSRD